MTDLTYDDQEKINEYLRVIDERILAPLDETEVQQYCTATLLLLFAAIDGLGKLLHDDANAKPGKRIRPFWNIWGGIILPKRRN